MKGVAWIIEVTICAILVMVFVGSLITIYREHWKLDGEMHIAKDLLYAMVNDPIMRKQLASGNIPNFSIYEFNYTVLVFSNDSSTHTFPSLLARKNAFPENKEIASLSYIIAGYYENDTQKREVISCKYYDALGTLMGDCLSLVNSSDNIYLDLSQDEYAIVTFSVDGDVEKLCIEAKNGTISTWGNFSGWVYLNTSTFSTETTLCTTADAIFQTFKIVAQNQISIDYIFLNDTELEAQFIYAPRKVVVGVWHE